jgi:hypothetical protein
MPLSDELLAVQRDVEVPLGEHRVLRSRRHRLVRAAVPNENVPPAVLAVGDSALERVVRHRVVFRLDRETPHLRVVAGSFGHGPAGHGTVDLEPHVVMKAACVVFLNDEFRARRGLLGRRDRVGGRRFLFRLRTRLRRSGRGFGRDVEPPLGAVNREPVPRAALFFSARLADPAFVCRRHRSRFA